VTDSIVFVGPSLATVAPTAMLGVSFRPPAIQGDVHRAAKAGAQIIGLIDGRFESVASVWHKEILWAMSRGIKVYGSSSIGALRAAELADFGMIGVGAVYKYFRRPLRDDADVAILHGPAAVGYVNLSEAQVNVYFTLQRAAREGVINRRTRSALTALSAQIFFKDRTYPRILRAARAAGIAPGVLRCLRQWLPTGRVDQKRLDACLLLDAVTSASSIAADRAPPFQLQHTVFWNHASLFNWPNEI
jgi:hypothetical protein